MITQLPLFVQDIKKFPNKAIHNKSTEFKIYDLRKYRDCSIKLDVVSHKNTNSKHKYMGLKILHQYLGFTVDSENSIGSVINDNFDDSIKLDFLKFDKLERFGRNTNPEEMKEKSNARIRLQIYSESGPIVAISNIIRFTQSNVRPNLDIKYIGFPPTVPMGKISLLVLTFDHPIMYYPDELDLCNGYESIKPYHREGMDFPTSFIEFDLSTFKHYNYNCLTVSCKLFNKETKIARIDNLRAVYPRLFSAYKPFEELSLVTPTMETMSLLKGCKIIQANDNRHLEDCAKLVRCRYISEIEKKTHSPLSYTIKNLTNHRGSTMSLDLVKVHDCGPHPSMKLYIIKPNQDFYVNADGLIMVTIDGSIGPSLSLNCLGIKMEKKKAIGKEAHNCRLRMAINGDSELSNIFRHFATTLSEDFYVTSVAFPLRLEHGEKVITITFSRDVPYYVEEFELQSGEEVINSIYSKESSSFGSCVSFDLSLFRNDITSLQLSCPKFKVVWDIDSNIVNKIYGRVNDPDEDTNQELKHTRSTEETLRAPIQELTHMRPTEEILRAPIQEIPIDELCVPDTPNEVYLRFLDQPNCGIGTNNDDFSSREQLYNEDGTSPISINILDIDEEDENPFDITMVNEDFLVVQDSQKLSTRQIGDINQTQNDDINENFQELGFETSTINEDFKYDLDEIDEKDLMFFRGLDYFNSTENIETEAQKSTHRTNLTSLNEKRTAFDDAEWRQERRQDIDEIIAIKETNSKQRHEPVKTRWNDEPEISSVKVQIRENIIARQSLKRDIREEILPREIGGYPKKRRMTKNDKKRLRINAGIVQLCEAETKVAIVNNAEPVLPIRGDIDMDH